MVRTTASASPEFSAPMRALAAALRPAFDASAASMPADRALADFAIQRHRVGPLLYAQAREGAVRPDQDAELRLKRHTEANAKRAAMAELLQARIVRRMADSRIPSLIFKGGSLAQRLYGDVTLRHCGDIDVLVPPEHFQTAAAILCTMGCVPAHTPLSAGGEISWMAARLLRDVALRDRTTGQRIELHQRLLFLPSWTAALETRDASFRPRLPTISDTLPGPDIGPALALYLLQHGALSGWRRLKWLVDVALLLPRLSPQAAAVLAGLAEDCGTAVSAKAGLALVRTVFGSELPAPLEAWLGEPAGATAVAHRQVIYAAHLSEPSDATPNPTNSRVHQFKSALMLADRTAQRFEIVTRGPAASVVRYLETRRRAGEK